MGGWRRVGARKVGARRVWAPKGGGPNPEKVGPEGWGPEGWEPEGRGQNPEKVGARRVGPEGWGPEGWGPEGWGPNPEKVGARRVGAKSGSRKGGGSKGGGPKGGGPNISRFFFPLPPQNSFFSSLSGGLLVDFWWCLKRRGTQMCTFGEPKRAHLRVLVFKTPPKINEKTPREGRKERIVRREREKKERNFGRSRERAVLGRAVLGRAVLGRRFSGRAVLGALDMTKPKP